MAGRILEPRKKLYAALGKIADKYHFAPLTEGPNGKLMHKNLVLMALTYILDKNHLLLGEPGWGKTTAAKIIAAKFSGVPYDVFDAVEIRGHSQKYEEKVVGRPNYGKLSVGEEDVVWQGTFGAPVLVVDEGNRLPFDTQDVILQGIDTGRWNYMNRSLYEGKKPTFITMNEKTGTHQNGFIPALKDRFDIVTEQGYWTTMIVFDLKKARANIQKDLCDSKYTQAALDALAKDYPSYKKALEERPIGGHLIKEEKQLINDEICGLALDNDGMLFLQAFMAEVNHSNQYGSKRASDHISQDTHDKNHAGVNVRHSFSPRSVMAAEEYAKAFAWFLQENPGLDHVRFMLPHIFALKATVTDEYKNLHGNDVRKVSEMLHLAEKLVEEVHKRYVESIQPMKNFIAVLQQWEQGERSEIKAEDDQSKQLLKDLTKIDKGEIKAEEAPSLKDDKHDHPLMKDLVREAREGDKKAFYEED